MSWTPSPFIFERQLDVKLTRIIGIPDAGRAHDLLVAIVGNLGVVICDGVVYLKLISECRRGP